MNEPLLLQRILDELCSAAEPAPRHIIRLRETTDCASFTRDLQQAAAAAGCGAVQEIVALPLINALSCRIRHIHEISCLPEVASIEADLKPALVHGFAPRLPIGGPAAGSVYTGSKRLIPWGVRHIQAPPAWRRSKGEQIRIGVIDTGIDYSHPDLQGAIGGGINLIQRHMLPVDDNGHGTHISGTIAASSRRGMTGVAPSATIYPVKAFDHNGTSFVTDIVKGIEWCVRNDLHIINMSFGMKGRSAALEAAVKSAFREGLIIVASSGNEGKKGIIDYPASYEWAIAVGATSRDRRIAPFTNRGSKIDIYAPGDRIVSTWLNGKYHELSGTSMATSHVSGVIALMLSLHPQSSFRPLLGSLQRTSLPVISSARKAGFLGEVNAIRALKDIARKRTVSAKR